MAWLYKIPPMMSALAFGYGVGTAAPDATLDGVAAVVQPGRPKAPATGVMPAGWTPGSPLPVYVVAAAAGGPGAGVAPIAGHGGVGPGGLSGTESDRLARLRGGGAGTSCRLHGEPGDSRRYSEYRRESRADEDPEAAIDVDDLDPAGQEALSRLQLPDFPVPITKSAIRYVRFLTRTNRGRDLFTSWLKRSGRYSEMIQQHLREWHLPEDLIWVAMIESGFDPDIKSPAGAMGLWQFMRSTGSVYGLEVNRHHDERKNPVKATRAAVHHLRDLHQRFGAWDLAFAAYNMGYEQLLDRIDRYGTSDFAELVRQRALPRETSAYVPKIVAAALVANNLERYGFSDIKVHKPRHFAELSVPGGARLGTIAKAADISVRTLRSFNPHLNGKYVPPGPEYLVMIPPEQLSRARAALPAMLDRRLASSDADVLLPDDLVGLGGGAKGRDARRRKNAWTEDENLLRYLPKPKRRRMRDLLEGRDASSPPSASSRPPAAYESSMGAVAEEFAPRRSGRETVMYRVGKGDTLLGVARQFAVDPEDLARDNDLEPEAKLREGQMLKLLVKPQVLARWKRARRDDRAGRRAARLEVDRTTPGRGERAAGKRRRAN
ncbi:MAG: transglycosylase SLT domain-containing protein [Myxococcota bacterium]